ncbi:hypothetical protein GFB56_24105 [Ensifer sp. T173]|jgi:hypothetical protein|uniref:Type VI secretion protein n=1 Tax=Ensifer canadensis TaxID=555315 RepID=A0AAW4FRD5_9HYPH|nr:MULTISPECIES: hypothetical protein [Ensifer]KQY73336.1 hypothetical protein ASD52_27350 [Ensifer sp. Root142]MBM3093848.1 hypothetical protein [Ensifer canadensis]PSS62751.1 hypothetical protein C6558_20165 [Ensifer sp. NM-2]UBI78174.1 hypothetical protein J3R84_27050 [Ensifer canadensis]
MRFLVRRLEAFNRDELPAWRGAQSLPRQALLFVPRILEFLVMYAVGLLALAAILVLMTVGWLTGLDRKAG